MLASGLAGVDVEPVASFEVAFVAAVVVGAFVVDAVEACVVAVDVVAACVV